MTNTTFEKFNVSALTPQQMQDLARLETFIQSSLLTDEPSVALIEGAAGTGKSVLLTALFRRLQKGARGQTGPYQGTKNYFTVNHPELLKVYQGMSQQVPELRQKDYVRPTSLINSLDKIQHTADVIVVDEGHLLLSKSEPYIKFTQENQLAELMKRAKVVVVVFDLQQVMQSKMMWTKKLLDAQLQGANVQHLCLDYQHRVQAPMEVHAWLDELGDGQLLALPSHLGNYDLRIFETAGALFEQIKQRDAEVGLSRVVATTGFPRRHADEHHVYMDTFDQPWDAYDPQKMPWAERPNSINEVGSIYTVQGFDLNYVGVILSPVYEYDAQQHRIVVNPDKVTHREVYKKRSDVTEPIEIARLEQAYLMNTLRVLSTRGVKGLYLTAADDQLRQALLSLRRPI